MCVSVYLCVSVSMCVSVNTSASVDANAIANVPRGTLVRTRQLPTELPPPPLPPYSSSLTATVTAEEGVTR